MLISDVILCCGEPVVTSASKLFHRAIDTITILFLSGTFTWITVQTSGSLTARAGHVALHLPTECEQDDKEQIAVFGGGDNAGGYFNDLVIFSPSSC